MSFISVSDNFSSKLFHVRDEKATDTDGGTSVSGINTRTLNTSMTNEISGASLASNQITLPAGTYFIFAIAPAYKSSQHKAFLRNITDSTDTVIGQSSHNNSIANLQTISIITGRFTIASSKTFEIRHSISVAISDNGLGVKTNSGTLVEVYTDVQIWKVS